jgi:phage baseplate assembly protein W
MSMYSDLDFSFGLNSFTKDVNKKTDINAVRQSIQNLILTNLEERPFDPNFGGGLYSYLFENDNSLDLGLLQHRWENLINVYEPRATIERVEILETETNFNVDIRVTYKVVLKEETITDTTSIVVELERLR